MLHAGISAYQNSSLTLKSARAQEAEMLARLNADLERARSNEKRDEHYHNALIKNQRVWNVFVVALAEEGHPYPDDLKARLISLGIWVNRQTQLAINEPERIDALVSLNRDIIVGLLAGAGKSDTDVTSNSDASVNLILE